MKIFVCPACAETIYFESTKCVNCGSIIGFAPAIRSMVALDPVDAGATLTRESLFDSKSAAGDAPIGQARLCANRVEHKACNWIIPAGDPEHFCHSCRLNTIIPSLSREDTKALWRRLEAAKRRLLYTVLALNLPFDSDASTPGLAFTFKQDVPGSEKVTTGHANGVITVNVAEADDAHRERTREALGERYRSLLGHFRHESGHYFWQRLVQSSPWLGPFREVFGDDREDYAEALKRHYTSGPPPDWHTTYISPYAASHPWEDWAETWAHLLHMIDTLETARSYGVSLELGPSGGPHQHSVVFRNLSMDDLGAMQAAWVPLSLALNDFNRGMGLSDLYPFAPSPAAIEKIRFVYQVVHNART